VSPASTKTCVIYTRISVSNEKSASIEVQTAAARKFAKARGWRVLETFPDDGVSATYNKPEKREGWQALLAHPAHFDAVVVYKIDRLARRVLDFLEVAKILDERGAGLVAVEDPVDLTTPQGRAFATISATFAELEAATISSRVAASRRHKIQTGLAVGGRPPYGWHTVPTGVGKVTAQNPETVGVVKQMADLVLAQRETVYGVMAWLNSEQIPSPTGGQWRYSTVERVLRHPILAGLTSFNPGNKQRTRGDRVLTGDDGLPVRDEDLAVISIQDWMRLVQALDHKTAPSARKRSDRATTSPLWSRLVTCGECQKTMHRGRSARGDRLHCPECFQSISCTQLLPHVAERLLTEIGDRFGLVQDAALPDPTALSQTELAIRQTTDQMNQPGADLDSLMVGLKDLSRRREALRTAVAAPRWNRLGQSVRTRWQNAKTDLERRAVLADEIEVFKIVRGSRGGRKLDTSRVVLRWRADPLEDE
jgi:DNA invertase Pin-like site-specific DNA recombinase